MRAVSGIDQTVPRLGAVRKQLHSSGQKTADHRRQVWNLTMKLNEITEDSR